MSQLPASLRGNHVVLQSLTPISWSDLDQRGENLLLKARCRVDLLSPELLEVVPTYLPAKNRQGWWKTIL